MGDLQRSHAVSFSHGAVEAGGQRDRLRVLSFEATGLVVSWLRGTPQDHESLLRADSGQQTRLLAAEVDQERASSRPWMQLCYLPGYP
ncbi:hypothetical protein [Sorangium sp. So ce124]|uniref:hypothetical protein n=1 Tax=Sorangium sp. So ce124 TaxID=3133280 RepID=UPI003F5FE2FD